MLKDINVNFRTKPRYRAASGRTNILDKSLYEDFKIKNPQYKGITWKQFKQVIQLSNEAILETVIENRDGFEFPKMLGFCFIATCKKPRKKNVDFNNSIKLGKVIYHKNWDTDGKIAKIFYTNYGVKYKLKDRQLWQFRPSRKFKNRLTASYKEKYSNYIEISGITKVWKIILKEKCQKLGNSSLE